MLLKKGLLRSTVDELEVLSDTGVAILVLWTYGNLLNRGRRRPLNACCSTGEGVTATFNFIVT